jgi:hypothetical protein
MTYFQYVINMLAPETAKATALPIKKYQNVIEIRHLGERECSKHAALAGKREGRPVNA